MTMVPGGETLLVIPVSQQPDFLRIVYWTDDIQPEEPRRIFDESRTIDKSLLDVFRHVIGDGKSA